MIFRAAALQRLASPDQLDDAVEITRPTGWLALAAVGAVLATTVAWSVLGAIPEKSAGQGLLLRSGGTATVVTSARGQIDDLLVAAGDRVERDQIVARLSQPVLDRQIRDAARTVEQLRSQHVQLVAFAASERALRARTLADKRRSLEQSIAAAAERASVYHDRLAVQEGLLAKGLVSQDAVLAARQERSRAADELTRLRVELTSLDLTDLAADRSLEQTLVASEEGLRQAEAQLVRQRADLTGDSELLSPYRGRVVELIGQKGAMVGEGAPVLTLELDAADLVAVIYVPATQAKLIAPGMAAEITPSTVKREEFGSIRGRVTAVSEFPATTAGMQRLLSNDDLVRRLIAQGSPHEVRVMLERDPATVSGFAWTSSRGPDISVTSGTLLYASIIVRELAPVQLLIPKLKKTFLGTEGLATPGK